MILRRRIEAAVQGKRISLSGRRATAEGRASVSVETPSRKAALAGWLSSMRQSWWRRPPLWAMSNHTSPSVLYRRIPSNRLLILANGTPAAGPTAVSDSRMGLSEKIRTRAMVLPKTLAKVSEGR